MVMSPSLPNKKCSGWISHNQKKYKGGFMLNGIEQKLDSLHQNLLRTTHWYKSQTKKRMVKKISLKIPCQLRVN